ncbi:hypothetical protein ABPG72_003367 [Tetrahymena utriculariae]
MNESIAKVIKQFSIQIFDSYEDQLDIATIMAQQQKIKKQNIKKYLISLKIYLFKANFSNTLKIPNKVEVIIDKSNNQSIDKSSPKIEFIDKSHINQLQNMLNLHKRDQFLSYIINIQIMSWKIQTPLTIEILFKYSNDFCCIYLFFYFLNCLFIYLFIYLFILFIILLIQLLFLLLFIILISIFSLL